MKLISLLNTRTAMSSAIASAKAALREEISKKLSTVTAEEKKKQSEQVVKTLLSLPAFQNSKRVSTFLSIENEINTEPIVRNIFKDGKECFVPRYGKNGMEMVKLKSMEDWETLPVTSWGIKQPKFSDKRENAMETGGLDFIIVPGVAFTAKGERLGHGGGYYDKFLTKIKQSQAKPPAIVAVAFKEQVVATIPTTEHDVVIDQVLYSSI